jgi:hypothetical protein
MCEPWMLERTGLSVAEHQRRTLTNYLELRAAAPDVPWVPVLQGWEPSDYLRHAESYLRAGVDLEGLPVVGLGSVCRRQHTEEAAGIVKMLQPLRLHGFGVKLTGVEAVGELLVSSDSMSWSIHARHRPPMYPECTHINCANCMRWALEWRQQVVGCAPPPRLVQMAFQLT